MNSQTKVFRTHRACAWLNGVAGVCIGTMMGLEGRAGSVSAGVAAFVVFSLLFALHHFTAQACKAGKPWGRRASQVFGVLLLAGFPMGTLIGIYLLRHTWKSWGDTPAAVV